MSLARADAIVDRLLELGGRPVTYKRDGTELALTAVRGQSRHPAIDRDGLVYRYLTRDYLCRASDLAGVWPPNNGDEIVDGDGTWLVVGTPGEGTHRQTGELVRIHTRKK